MKKTVVFLLLTSFFLNTSLKELLKIPVLANHFAEHSELDPSVDFVDFLSMHYWGQDVNDNDQDRDMQLPFKKLTTHSSIQLYCQQKLKLEIVEQDFFTEDQKLLPLEDLNFTGNQPTGLFRPPRA